MKYPLFILLLLSLLSCSKDNYPVIRDLSPEEQHMVSEFEMNYVKRTRHDIMTKSDSPNDVILLDIKQYRIMALIAYLLIIFGKHIKMK